MLLQYQGLAESAGESISSNCHWCGIAGAPVLFLLIAFAAAVACVLLWALQHRAICWEKSAVLGA